MATDPDDYVSKAVRLASDRTYRDAVSARIIERRSLLFGESTAAAVADEWSRFIERGVRMACPQEAWGGAGKVDERAAGVMVGLDVS